MSVKIILTWNIRAGKEQEYYGFVVGDYLPQLNSMGLEMSDAWLTVYGNEPQILVGAVLPSLAKAQALIESEGWEKLTDQLLEFVEDYDCKISYQKGGFQF